MGPRGVAALASNKPGRNLDGCGTRQGRARAGGFPAGSGKAPADDKGGQDTVHETDGQAASYNHLWWFYVAVRQRRTVPAGHGGAQGVGNHSLASATRRCTMICTDGHMLKDV